MLKKIEELLERAKANIANHLHVAEALHAVAVEVEAIKARLVGLGHEATGETGAAVTVLDERLSALTSAVSSLGSLVTSNNVQALDAYSRIASRVAALESTPSAPAVPVVPVTVGVAADVKTQQS